MFYSAYARFHITLISRRWYNDKKFFLNQDHASMPSYQIEKDESDISEQSPLQLISFSHLERIRKMPDIIQIQELQAMQDVTNTIEQDTSVQKRSRLCQKCKQPGHYAP
ncbi:unnamed protein product [Rhizophagus irregularis]|nr:unnamed protein product [Rhizophagus irregularis]